MSDQPRGVLDLSGVWQYEMDIDNSGEEQGYYRNDFPRENWKTMKIPNNWYLTEVGDYDGTVWFSTSFEAPEGYRGKHLTLQFYAVDYFADVWLNGEYLGAHAGYFTPFSFDVSSKVQFGKKNILIVKDASPRDTTEYVPVDTPTANAVPMSASYRTHWAKALTLAKGHMNDAMHRPGAMTKYRQDGNSGGIWQKVELIARERVYIEHVKVYTKIVEKRNGSIFEPDGSAIVSADITINNTTKELKAVDLGMLIRADNFDGKETYERTKLVQLQPGLNTVKLIKTIVDAKLWWTWDHGFPHLYHMDVVIGGGDAIGLRFGIKEVRRDKRENWVLNGKRVFLRGMRYLSSMWMSEMNRERYYKDISEMPELYINSVRIGSHVEMDDFYDICDELGLLVWQVFPLHYCYSDSDEFIENIAPMMNEMVKMFYNHASVGIWSTFKEPQVYALPNPPNNWGRLCELMYEAARTADTQNWVHRGDYQEGVQNFMPGYCQPGLTNVKKVTMKPNIVEFGCGALPCLETMKTFIPAESLWPPQWDVWEYWCLYYNITFGFSRIDMGHSVEEFIYNSQAYAARNIKEQMEFIRQRKYAPIGSMYLYFWNDPLAAIGSGLYDYFRRKYLAYDAFKQVYTPVLACLEWNKDEYILGFQKQYNLGEIFEGKLWIINDYLYEIKGATLAWKLMDASGKTMISGDKTLDIAYDSNAVVDSFRWIIDGKGLYKVEMTVTDSSGKTLSYNDFEFEAI